MEQEVQQAKQKVSLKEILAETAAFIRRRRESKEIVGLRRRPLLPDGKGGEYLAEEVIGVRP